MMKQSALFFLLATVILEIRLVSLQELLDPVGKRSHF